MAQILTDLFLLLDILTFLTFLDDFPLPWPHVATLVVHCLSCNGLPLSHTELPPRFFARGQVLSDQGVKDCVMPAAHVGRAWLEEVRMLATSRRLPEMQGHPGHPVEILTHLYTVQNVHGHA